MERVKTGNVMVRNPVNKNQVNKVDLRPNNVECIVFWTKNPEPFLPKLKELDDLGYTYYFHVTINSYDQTIERNIPRKKHIVASVEKLAEQIGKHKIIWRYDPILLTDKVGIKYHKKYFDLLAQSLQNMTKTCVISFVDLYKKTKQNMQGINYIPLTDERKQEITQNISKSAQKYGFQVQTCAEDSNFESLGIFPGKCVDDQLIYRITGKPMLVGKDKSQRKACGCVKSVDIGQYNTCTNGCLYCYANYDHGQVQENVANHQKTSQFIVGELLESDEVIERKDSKKRKNTEKSGQPSLLSLIR